MRILREAQEALVLVECPRCGQENETVQYGSCSDCGWILLDYQPELGELDEEGNIIVRRCNHKICVSDQECPSFTGATPIDEEHVLVRCQPHPPNSGRVS